MHQDYTKICRVCMSDGSRDIFQKPSMATTAEGAATGAVKSVSPLERLLEKLRYVTMMKIEENDDLPRLLCDLCIVQLNVAYNFKRQAVENDTKLRQYFIENGISSNQPMILNEAPSLRSSFAASHLAQPQPHTRFPILPLIVKTEPSDVDAFSDATTETNVETDRLRFQSVVSNTTNSSPEETIRRANNSTYPNERNQSSMVYVNSNYEFNSVTPSSDIEFVQNYQLNANNRNQSNDQRQSPNVSKTTNNVNQNISPSSTSSAASPLGRESHKRGKSTSADRAKAAAAAAKRKREIANLSIDMVPSSVQANMPKEHRRALGKTTRVRPTVDKTSTVVKPKQVSHIPADKIKTTGSPTPTKRPISGTILSSAQLAAKKLRKENSAKTLSSSTPTKTSKNLSEKTASPKMIVFNPFNTTKKTIKLPATKKTEASTKRKSQQKLLRPKIEPPPANKKN